MSRNGEQSVQSGVDGGHLEGVRAWVHIELSLVQGRLPHLAGRFRQLDLRFAESNDQLLTVYLIGSAHSIALLSSSIRSGSRLLSRPPQSRPPHVAGR